MEKTMPSPLIALERLPIHRQSRRLQPQSLMLKFTLALLSNALRHTPSGGTVRLSAEAHDGSMYFGVEDSGRGIAPEALPQVFDRFYRADASRQHDGSSGLGLAIVRSIVEAHAGTIAVESIVGQGTTFTISLPASVVSSPMATAGAPR